VRDTANLKSVEEGAEYLLSKTWT